jgi:mono/diheme cytochrome c family protein
MMTRSGWALVALALACVAQAWVARTAWAQPAADAVARGRTLVEGIAGCGNCHTPNGPQGKVAEKNLAGGFMEENPAFRAVAANITPDRETGIGAWSDAEIARAIREGISRDGRVMGPPMPFELYRKLSDADTTAIIAYLRSVPAVRNAVEKSTYRIPLPPSYGPPVAGVQAPPRSDLVAYGAYLAGPVGHCTECHTPLGKEGRDWSQTGKGGQPFHGPWGVSVARNITSSRTHGIGDWTDAEIERAIRQGIAKDGRQMFPPMGYAYYARIDAEDMKALIAYLRTIPPRD